MNDYIEIIITVGDEEYRYATAINHKIDPYGYVDRFVDEWLYDYFNSIENFPNQADFLEENEYYNAVEDFYNAIEAATSIEWGYITREEYDNYLEEVRDEY